MKDSNARKAITTSQRTSFSWPFTQKCRPSSKWVFYPGCALAATNPILVENVMKHLKKMEPSSDLLYGCCGKPSQAIGLDDMYQKNISTLKSDLASAKVEKLITACPNCHDIFKEELGNQVDVVFLWSHLLSQEAPGALVFPDACSTNKMGGFLIHDACVMKSHPAEMNGVRDFAERMDIMVDDFPGHRAPVCCGKKNMLHMTNPKAYMALAQRRVIQADGKRILTYCQSCAHSFDCAEGKALSLMELTFGGGHDQRPANGMVYWKNRIVNALRGLNRA